MINIMAYLSRQPRSFLLAAGFGLVGVMAVIDYLTGPEFSSEIFYFVPILLVAWLVGTRAGTLIAIASAVAMQIVDLATHSYSGTALYYLNSAVKLFIFLVIAQLAAVLERLH